MNGDIGHSIRQEGDSLKDNNKVIVKDNFSRDIGSFLINDILAIASLKIEKLAAAVYLVSGLLSDNEPIKWNVRKNSTDVVSDISFLSLEKDKRHSCPIENISYKIFQITSILRIAWIGGLISKMNYEILVSEYTKLNDFLIKNFKDGDDQKESIKESFFASREISTIEDRISLKNREEKYLGEEFLDPDTSSKFNKEERFSRGNFIKDISSKGHLSDKKGFVLNNIQNNSIIKTRTLENIISGSVSDRNKRDRHTKILSAMSPGISYSVSEIMSIIGKSPDTSEKTVQRDLQLLVSIGRLKKTGERRWSRYSLS